MGFGVSPPSLFNNNPKFHKDCMGTAYDLFNIEEEGSDHFIIVFAILN